MHPKKLLVISLCGLLLALAIVVNAAPPLQEEPAAIPPQVAETSPFEGEELLLDQSITLYFDQAMDRASVEAALKVSTAADTPYELTWEDDLSLSIQPSQNWEREAEVLIELASTASSQAGLPMEDPYRLAFITVGYLEVIETIPQAGSIDVAANNTIGVAFNRPVVPLVSINEQDDLPSPISITPPLSGQGRWVNTALYVFTPDEKGLTGGTDYTVTVAAGLEDTTGALLLDNYTWSFSTILPQIVEVSPRPGGDGYGAGGYTHLDQVFRVRFSQPMERPSTQTAFSLLNLKTGQVVVGEFEWTEDSTSFSFTPDALLDLEGEYNVLVAGEIARSATGAPLRESFASDLYLTAPYPAIIDTRPGNGAEGTQPYGGFEIFFNTRIDPKTLEDKIIVEPEPWRAYDSFYYDYNSSYQLFFDTEPSTDYTITILPGIADPYGNEIQETAVIRYRSGDYEAEINLNAGYIGLYSAYKPTTRVFATHRNVSRLDLNLYTLEAETLVRLFDYSFQDNWEPRGQDLLRQWSLQVQSQPNQRRYELLLVSDQGVDGVQTNVECLGAPAPRMQVGDFGQVADDDPRPLRVRGLPNLGGEILGQLEPGVGFNVIDGPICADGFLWWNIESDGLIGWSAEGTADNYFIEMVERRETVPADADPADYPALAPGLYALQMSSPETRALNYGNFEHLMMVSTVNLTLKYSPTQLLAWATDMQTGLPVAGLPVSFYNSKFELFGTLNTNAEGLALLEISPMGQIYEDMFALVQTGDQFGFASAAFDEGIAPWRFDLPTDYEPEQEAVYVYTDRGIYRPGQPVYFRGIVRERQDADLFVPDMASIFVQVFDPESQIVFEGNLPLTEFGSFAGEFTLASEAALGYYTVSTPVNPDSFRFYGVGFQVAEYVAPEYTLSLTAAQSEVLQGETIQVLVEASYFFGGAVSNAEVEWNVYTEDYNFQADVEGYYDFVDYNYDGGPGEYYGFYGENTSNGSGQTDDQGQFIIEVPADLGTRSQSQIFTFDVTITDESLYQVAKQVEVIVHQGEIYVGGRALSYIGRAGQESVVEVIAVDWDSQVVADQSLRYEVFERRWSSVQEEDELGRTVWTWEVEEIALADGAGDLVTGPDGKTQLSFIPPQGGTYKVYLTSQDTSGNEVKSSTFLWVSGSDYVAWRQQNSDRFDLITDAQEYNLGDTAEILIASPFQGEVTALITVERGRLISQEVRILTSNSEVYELPITGDFAPNVFVSVILVKGEDENNPYSQFRMGMAQLTVNTEQLIMNVEITPQLPPEGFVGPGDTLTYAIKTTDWEGNPVSAEVGIGVTDLAILSLAPANPQTLLDYFYSERGVSVRTSTPLTVSVDRVTQTIIDTVKGGGGGGGEAGIFDVRQDFVDTPGWEPTLITDENGEATYTLVLPDNLTTWRLDARAVTRGGPGERMLVGQTMVDVISTKPLLLRPLTPRFLIVGDVVTFGTIVNNNTDSEQVVEVSLEGTGFELSEGQTLKQTVTIPSKGRQRVNWEARVLETTAVDITFFAASESFNDASKPTATQGRPLPVYRYEAPEVVGTGGVLGEAGSRSELISLPRRFEVTQGELTIQLDRSLAASTVAGLDYLENYPHQCTEQTVSRFLPNVVNLRALQSLNLSSPELEANLDQQVSFGIQRLYSTQKSSGAWGWFPESRENPYVTAYALYGLTEARAAGYPIDETVIGNAAIYLQTWLNDNQSNSEFNATWRMFSFYAMAKAGFPQTSGAAIAYDRRASLTLDGQIFLAMALAEVNPDDPRLATLLSDLLGQAAISANGAYWDGPSISSSWSTSTRTTALALRLLVKLDPANPLIPQVVRWLMLARELDRWETTQETAWAVMALTDWMVASGDLRPEYQFSLALNGAGLAQDLIATQENATQSEILQIQVADLLSQEANRLSFIRSEGEGNLYYTAYLRAFLPVEEIEPVSSRGIILDRRYYRAGDENKTPVTEAQAGEELVVELTIILPNSLNYVMIEDPIPAGAAAIDPNLDISSIADTAPRFEDERGWGWWWFTRQEFRDEKTVLYADFLPPGTYTFRYGLRLGLPGVYNVIPATGQEFYLPDIYGRSAGMIFTITPRPPTED